ncbi:Na+/H+ antiporter NhaC family protein [Anaerosphaera multitolerans]|uniref:Sodium:proton antiporter n=1 Tax=Anaerosphaera multitolerans TaxID=2487351 RepID=A0A437S6D0_9FIRM|nr:Na+/H+ antiporter NhaC family protein [Anaerosphaera multitolerans]RVU54557.1 sodium:proton antiporter [Anaerosphaera multitolerans]
MLLLNPVIVSVVVMCALAILKVDIMLAIFLSAILAGLMSPALGGFSFEGLINTISIFISGLGDNGETALAYVLLGALATAIATTDLVTILSRVVTKIVGDKKKVFILVIAAVGCLSQNLVPIHIAYMPILIPPLIPIMNKLKIDRRAMATALTFSVKMPYVAFPFGFGLLFHTIIADAMTKNGLPFDKMDVWKGTMIPGLSMIIGLLVAVFFVFNKDRDYEEKTVNLEKEKVINKKFSRSQASIIAGLVAGILVPEIYKAFKGYGMGMGAENSIPWKEYSIVFIISVIAVGAIVYLMGGKKEDDGTVYDDNKREFGAIIALVLTVLTQLLTSSLPLGGLVGVVAMVPFGVYKFKDTEGILNGGVDLMGYISFVMLVAAGYAAVIVESGQVPILVEGARSLLGDNKIAAAVVMLLVGLTIDMGIGTSFGTVPIIAAIYVPLGLEMGFTPTAIACLIGIAAALGDAGAPASDSTLGPTAALNVDGQHDHIRDTCIPTFLSFNIPLFISAVIMSVFVLT